MSISVIPQPSAVRTGGPEFQLSAETVLIADDQATEIANLLRDRLKPSTGFQFPNADAGQQTRNAIALEVQDRLGPSAYELKVGPEGVRIIGGDPAGLFHGTQTLLQLCPAQVFRTQIVEGVDWLIPGVEIDDRPRFQWRGFLLDVSRHYFGVGVILSMIDALALHRMNVLHLHLTDDQGWRIEIKRYPRLTEIGSWRSRSMIGSAQEALRRGARYDETPHGGFLSQEDVHEIVAYAAARFITVVPEIDLPGHSQAAIAAYPWLGNTDEQLEVWTDWGVNPHVLNVSDEMLTFYRGVLEEVLDLFPSRFIHIGGDECPKDEWQASTAAQARMMDLGLRDEEELQSWVIRQMAEFLSSRGRRLVGWDEILQGGLPHQATVMSWQGESGGVAAARAGHDVVMAPDESTYFYHHQSSEPSQEPLGVPPVVDLETVFSYEPVPAELTAVEARHVLGAQCQMWTEFVASPRQMQQMVFPRLCAFAEAVWSDDRGQFNEFEQRLLVHIDRLKTMDLAVYEPRTTRTE